MREIFKYDRTTSGQLLGSLIVLIVLTFVIACTPSEKNGDNSDRIVAKVFNKSLSQSELNDIAFLAHGVSCLVPC